jgi:hypothetical protein
VILYRENKRRWELEGFLRNLSVSESRNVPYAAASVTESYPSTITSASAFTGGNDDDYTTNSFERKKAAKRTLHHR